MEVGEVPSKGWMILRRFQAVVQEYFFQLQEIIRTTNLSTETSYPVVNVHWFTLINICICVIVRKKSDIFIILCTIFPAFICFWSIKIPYSRHINPFDYCSIMGTYPPRQGHWEP